MVSTLTLSEYLKTEKELLKKAIDGDYKKINKKSNVHELLRKSEIGKLLR